MSIADKLSAIAENVPRVYEAGWNAAYRSTWDEAYESGWHGGYNKRYDEFWDSLQQNGERVDYQYSFCGIGWTNDTFKPKYDIAPTYAAYMFARTGIEDLVTVGVSIDFSKATGITRVFEASAVKRVGTIDLSNQTAVNTFFISASNLETVGLLKVSPNGTTIFGTSAFQGCSSLVDIEFDGMLNSAMDMSACPLSTESVQSIIDHLKDLTGATTKTLTLSSASITEVQEAAISAKNWTLVI